MKKLTLLFGTALMALTISSVSAQNSNTPPVLVRTITNIDAGTNSSLILNYNGSKIASAGNTTFTYTGDFITKAETVEGKNRDCIEYTYDANGKLLTETVKNNGGRRATLKTLTVYNYTYNADGTVTAKEMAYTDGANPKAAGSIKFTIDRGNVIKEERFDAKGVSTDMTTYEYDLKNTIYKNVTGADKLICAQNFGDNNENNFVKWTIISGNGEYASSTVTTYVYTYSAQGYPQSVVSTEVYTAGLNPATTTVSNTVYGY